jgi:hypothetical protein
MQSKRQEAHELAGTVDRRSEQRQANDAEITIQLETREFGGHTVNLSPAGVFFFSPDRLRVTVEIEDQKGRRTARGTLVRAERLDATSTGYAIEFEA